MFLETLFIIHGAMVAYTIMNQGVGPGWSHFVFGGIMTFLLCQMHGLGLSTRAKWLVAAPPLAVMAFVFFTVPDSMGGSIRLTLIMFGGTLACALMVFALIRFAELFGVDRDRLVSPAR